MEIAIGYVWLLEMSQDDQLERRTSISVKVDNYGSFLLSVLLLIAVVALILSAVKRGTLNELPRFGKVAILGYTVYSLGASVYFGWVCIA